MSDTQDETAVSTPHPVHSIFPAAYTRVVRHYTDFSETDPPHSAKEVVAFHTACKAAIGHLSALLKLEKLCGLEKHTPQDDVETLLRETRQALLTTESDHDDD